MSCSAAKRKMWKLKSFGSLRNINKTGNQWGCWEWCSSQFVLFVFILMTTKSFCSHLHHSGFGWTVGSISSINSCSSWSWNSHNPCLSLCFFIFAHRRRERRLHHSVVHRADLAFWGSESGRKRLVGVGYRESDPGQSAVLWEWQKQGKQNTFCPISKPSGGQQRVLLHWRNKSTVPRTVQQKYPLLGTRKDCSSS